MSLYSFIDANFINPIKSFPIQCYHSMKKTFSILDKEKRDSHHIVVSLTSFPPRYNTLHLVIKSILNQVMKPNLIFLCLSKQEIKDKSKLPSSVLNLEKHGLHIFLEDDNLRPHNKYFYAMRQYPNSIIITVDDDAMYDNNLVLDLYTSYLKNKTVVSARRVHKIIKDGANNLLPYNRWGYEYKKTGEPSHSLFATGVGGVLYPPGIFPPETFDAEKIKKLCLNADDIWLKFMEIRGGIPVTWVKGKRIRPLSIIKSQKISLQKYNYHENKNDKYIICLQNYYGIDLASYLGE